VTFYHSVTGYFSVSFSIREFFEWRKLRSLASFLTQHRSLTLMLSRLFALRFARELRSLRLSGAKASDYAPSSRDPWTPHPKIQTGRFAPFLFKGLLKRKLSFPF
jgi:hypothetical protein